MKKVITLCLFAFAMLVGTQTTFAQDQIKVNEKASIKAKELRSQLKFDDLAMEQIYMAYQTYENKMFSVEKHITEGTAEHTQVTSQVQKNLQSSIKSAIGDVLFQRYLILTDQMELDQDEPETQNRNATQIKKTR